MYERLDIEFHMTTIPVYIELWNGSDLQLEKKTMFDHVVALFVAITTEQAAEQQKHNVDHPGAPLPSFKSSTQLCSQ